METVAQAFAHMVHDEHRDIRQELREEIRAHCALLVGPNDRQ
jgi:hypothetical protein